MECRYVPKARGRLASILLLTISQGLSGCFWGDSGKRNSETSPSESTGSDPTPGGVAVEPDQPTTVSPFEPIKFTRIKFPAEITDVLGPTWTADGEHLFFSSSKGGKTSHLYTVKADGTDLNCLSCDLENESEISPDFAYPMPDGKRAFIGGYTRFYVLECAPSILNCKSKTVLPIDVTEARPSVTGLILVGGGAAPHLAPDGVHFAFSDVRSDAAELMVMGRLERQADKYMLKDPRVINPPGPNGATDRSPEGWSNGGVLYEFKSFADGGKSATYVGFRDSANPDVIKVDLATGKTSRLTSHPDWDEDNAPSRDGKSIIVASARTMHRIDMFGMLPARPFIETPLLAAAAIHYVGSEAARQCDIQPWLMPMTGDEDGKFMGQPINPYNGGDIHAANNITGMDQWSPDGTKVALQQISYTTHKGAPYLLIANLVARKPSQPMPIVSSAPGPWAKSPADFRGSIQSNQPVLVDGLHSGNAVITYSGIGVLGGVSSVVYNKYSDDGENFIDGVDSIVNGLILLRVADGQVMFNTDLTLSGKHTGTRKGNLIFKIANGSGNASESGASVTGTVTSTYDGTTISGPPEIPKACPEMLPKKHPLKISTENVDGVLRVVVTSTISGAGRSQKLDDTRPVWRALVTVNGQQKLTNQAGVATFPMPVSGKPANITAAAGDTMVPASVTLSLQ